MPGRVVLSLLVWCSLALVVNTQAATPDVWLAPAEVGLAHASAGLRYDPVSQRFSPAEPTEPVTLVYRFRATDATPAWAVQYNVSFRGPDARLEWAVLRARDDAVAVATDSWHSGPARVDFGPALVGRAGETVALRLTLAGAVSVTGLAWVGTGLAPLGGELPLTAWLQPAYSAQLDGRRAQGLPPRPVPVGPPARTALAPAAEWEPRDDGAQATLWDARAPRRGGSRLLYAIVGPSGGSVGVAGFTLASGPQPGLWVGGRLPEGLVSAGGAPPLVVRGCEPESVRLLCVGPLELRWAFWRHEELPDGAVRLWVDAVVVNHGDRALEGGLVGVLGGGEAPVETAAGYRYAPGASLATLVCDLPAARHWRPGAPVCYELELTVDDGREASDTLAVPLGLRTAVRQGGRWLLDGAPLDEPRAAAGDALAAVRAAHADGGAPLRLRAPLAEEVVDEADRLGVPLVVEASDGLLSESLRWGQRPSVLAVVAGPAAGPPVSRP